MTDELALRPLTRRLNKLDRQRRDHEERLRMVEDQSRDILAMQTLTLAMVVLVVLVIALSIALPTVEGITHGNAHRAR